MMHLAREFWERFTTPLASAFQAAGALLAVAVGIDQESRSPGTMALLAESGSFPTGSLFTWIVIGGGASFFARQVGELIFSAKSGWRRADAGTDHEKWETCERNRAADAERIKGLTDQLQTALALVAAKDVQITNMMQHAKERDVLLDAMNARMMATNTQLIQHVVTQATTPTTVTLDASSLPVSVHEVGEVRPDA